MTEYEALNFITTSKLDTIFNLFDTGAFNDISLSYLILALRDLKKTEIISEAQAKLILYSYSNKLHNITAKEAFSEP